MSEMIQTEVVLTKEEEDMETEEATKEAPGTTLPEIPTEETRNLTIALTKEEIEETTLKDTTLAETDPTEEAIVAKEIEGI